MGYSNWANSKWHTFWSEYSRIRSNKKRDQLFEILGVKSFTYGYILDKGVNHCIRIVKNEIGLDEIKKYTKEDFDELITYFIRFLKDVELNIELSR